MDMQVAKKKLGLKEKYQVMTRDLDWTPTYQKMEDIYPYVHYEGIKIHDWDRWEDPFRLTMDAYWKYQAEKEKKLYAIIDAYAQNNGHLNVTDARYINTVKLFLTGVSPLEYMAHRGFAHVGRAFPGPGPRVACLMQSLDEMRHFQTQVHAISNYNKYYNGFHDFRQWHDRVWYLSVPKSFFDDAITAGPFEFMVAIGFSFEYVLTNLLFVPFVSGAAYNGDMGTMAYGFSAQSDEARHMTLGLEVIKFILEQDPDNLPIVQRWIDKWTWRGYRVLMLVAMMMDYMLPKRTMSWKEAWEIYFEENGGALFRDLSRYGIRMPKCAETIALEKDHLSHQAGALSTTTPRPRRSIPGYRPKTRCSGSRQNIPRASTNTTARAGISGASRRPRGTVSTTPPCRCCARPARSPCSSPSRAIRPRSAIAKPITKV